MKDREAYNAITRAFKGHKSGASIADIAAKTALPLAKVKELVPAVVDEYRGRLQVTESGEILYSFPRGFKSKYRGFGVFLRKTAEKLGKGIKILASAVFKVWIMVMLIGYFAIFMVLALAALLLSITGNSNNSNNRNGNAGGLLMMHGIFDLIIRLWFYSEIRKSFDPYQRGKARPAARPLHKAIFSFVFGDGDPNADWSTREKQALIAYIQANKGVLSLPEYVMLTGVKPADAEAGITAFCVEFNGSPEATDQGTVVYRFDELLRRADTRDRTVQGTVPIKALETFSSNKKNMNVWFCIINGVNVLFGGYFLYNAMRYGTVISSIADVLGKYGKKIGEVTELTSQLTGATLHNLYGMTYHILGNITQNPLPVITVGLGLVPLVFSALFWLVPALRSGSLKKRNEDIKMENLRKISYSSVWTYPLGVRSSSFVGANEACKPGNLAKAQDKLIKELGAYSQPEVRADETGVLYDFPELAREKAALVKYRESMGSGNLGAVVFDSN